MSSAQKLRILIAEDEKMVQDLWKILVRYPEFSSVEFCIVDHAHDARIKLEGENADPFDALITDLSMPNGPYNGLELIRKIRRNQAFDSMPIHLVTGHPRGSNALSEQICKNLDAKNVTIWQKGISLDLCQVVKKIQEQLEPRAS